MALLINSQAIADFVSEGVDPSAVMTLFSSVTSFLNTIATLSQNDFTGQIDDSMPSDLSAECQALWGLTYVDGLEKTNQSAIDTTQLSVYRCIASLFSLTVGVSVSRQDVIDQLTYTLTAYGNTEGLAFLTDMT